jgi:hypothetical protein
VYDGWHVAVYVTYFSELCAGLLRDGIVLNTQSVTDQCYSLADAARNLQVRVRYPAIVRSADG